MKIIKNILISIFLLLSLGSLTVSADLFDIKVNNGISDNNLNTGNKKADNNNTNEHLDGLKETGDNLFNVTTLGEKGISQTLFNIAKDLKNVFFILAGLYFVILVLKLIFTDNTEEEVGKFKKGIIWISIGLVITQISYSFVKILYDNDINGGLANNFIDDIIYPLIKLLQTGASFLFIAIAIYSFYRIVTANGDEEAIKTGKMSVLYSIIGFIVIKLSRGFVDTIYGEVDCGVHTVLGFIETTNSNCTITEDLDGFVRIVMNIINWSNGLVGIAVVILIIYTGAQVILSVGDEEILKKAKRSIMYIIFGIFLLVVNYLIMTFFILPETII